MRPSEPPQFETCLDALVAARGASDVGAALLVLVGAPFCAGMQVFRVDVARGLLLSLGASPDGPAALTRDDGPAWRAVRTGEVVDAPGGFAAPLRGDQAGEIVGVAVVTGDRSAALDRILRLAGRALARAVEADHARFDAAAFAALLPLLDDGVLFVTTDGELLHYTPSLARISGWSAAEVAETGWTNLVYATDEERGAAQRAVAALTLGRPSEGVRRSLQRKGGERFVAGIWTRLVPDPAGGAAGLLGLFRDVTREEGERKEAIRAEGLAELGRVTRWVAHDMNNLLCAVGGHAELIDAWTGDARVQRSAQTIRDSVRRGSGMTRRLLASDGGGDGLPGPVRVARVVREACELYEATAPSGVRVDVEADGDAVVDADATQLHQVVLNLLTNAGQACAAGGVIRVGVELGRLPEGVSWRSAAAPAVGAPVVRVTVHDSGPGFSVLDPAQLFAPFYTTRRGGHGVGLAAVRTVVNAHDGAILLTNEGGARVDIYLPPSDRPEVALDGLLRARGTATGRRVWLLDDEPTILEFARVALTARGLQVRDFATPAALIEAARCVSPDAAPDLLVLDDPHGIGGEAVVGVRQAGLPSPVLWTSGDPRALTERLAREGTLLAKPYTGGVLADRVVGLVGARPGGAG